MKYSSNITLTARGKIYLPLCHTTNVSKILKDFMNSITFPGLENRTVEMYDFSNISITVETLNLVDDINITVPVIYLD